ncbi:unnamed protein product [Bursaphelenchus okinawaensis]|uniref:Uncharacterized protein n=1 Tax=Bursaphelenchus okinawaensis TaxID=465554 RepID=A0A811KKS0_9BILA|nr:unnamed protein product [Bursaphelenchus okinawaensis]CAG9106682.1 unnamed protein product [Bursaphelenchus okinawaensis]
MSDLDFPDEEEASNDDIVNSLFGGSRPKTSSRRRPASATNLPTKKSTVSFQEPPKPTTSETSRRPAPSFDSSVGTSGLSLPVPPRAPLQNPTVSSSRALDDLFSTPARTEERPERQDRPRGSRRSQPVEEEKSQPKDYHREEIENLKKELSTIKYERNEDQQVINDLRRENANLRDDHEKELKQLRKDFRVELEELQQKYEAQLKDVRQNVEDDIDVVRNVKKQEDQLVTVQSRLENVDYTLNSLKDAINSLGNYNEPVNRIVDLAEKQIRDGMELLHQDQQNFQAKKEQLVQTLENELAKMITSYVKEVAEGRQWVLSERIKLEAERKAFQEEQNEILSQIEERKTELDKLRTDFVTKEHDLLVRVVNERHKLDEERRTFERQRNADINRMREEAEHLEKCFMEVQRSHQALQVTQFEVELEKKKVAEFYEEQLKKELEDYRGYGR